MQKIVTPPEGPGGSGSGSGRVTDEATASPARTPGLAESQRYHAMDALRASMMLLGVLFHASLPYVTFRRVSWFFDPSQNFGFDLFAVFTHSFRMPVFFLAAGFFAALLYEKRGLRAMAHNRFLRIVIPFLLGWLILAPLCVAAMKFGVRTVDGGSYEAGWQWLQGGKWLQWNDVFHLWFLVALVVLYPAGLAVRWLMLRLPDSTLGMLRTGARRFFASPWRPLLLLVPAAAFMIPLQFDRFNAFSIYAVLLFSLFFAMGWVLHSEADLLPKMGRAAWLYVAVALVMLPALAVSHRALLTAPSSDEPAIHVLVLGAAGAVVCSFMVFGTLGLVVTYANRPSAVARYLADSSYWIYLVHLPLVLLIGALLSLLPLPALAKWLLTLAIAVPILFASYHLLVRYTPIGALLNGRRHRQRQPAMAAS
jgi:peptidoglycan/LPS O-acetylase OafA/YrhL